MFDSTDQLAVNTLRTLSLAQINKANSGHPGLPLGAAPMAYTLFQKHLKVTPKASDWFNRDRFVLSAGHGSALLYSLLHLFGFQVSMEDLKNFRQWGSKTPGHPEYRDTDGVEVTTGPLGQGFANAVGMAMAEAHLAKIYNKEGFPLIDHYTYVLCGDGDLMEGISYEAASLAGHHQLEKLIVLHDSNDVSLDGDLKMAFSEDLKGRFESQGWQYLRVEDGNDLEEISRALDLAKECKGKPTFIEVKTVIGYGSPNQGTSKVHGAPLGAEDTRKTEEFLGWNYPDFFVPSEVMDRMDEVLKEKQAAYEDWKKLEEAYAEAYPEEAKRLEDAIHNRLPEGWDSELPEYSEKDQAMATRKYSQACIQALAEKNPSFWGGSADLSCSNNTVIGRGKAFLPGQEEDRNIWYGVREFAMAAIMNGILLHGGTKTFAATFFVFSDYLKPAMRLASLSELPAIYVFTHDSVAVGEDGPTHEPVEQLACYRSMPNLDVIRPADGNETVQAWKLAMESVKRPTALVLTRQNVPVLKGTKELAADGVRKGAYVLAKEENSLDGILIATGSEVSLALEAKKLLKKEGVDVRVVSMPSQNRFEEQMEDYQESVLPSDVVNRMSIEMGTTYGWGRYVGLKGLAYGIDRFGASAPGSRVVEEYGFTAEKIAKAYLKHFK